jgi:RHS repeat-associated protein
MHVFGIGTPTCEGTATTPLGYDGQDTNTDTGLIYLREREYDPDTAQFPSRDPLEAITGEPYSYAKDNPLIRADPTGRCGLVCIDGIVLGGFAVATGVGEVVGATVAIGEATVSLSTASAIASAGATAADTGECVTHEGVACVGASVGAVATAGASAVAFGATGDVLLAPGCR